MVSTEWVDAELQNSIDKRQKLNRIWRDAKKHCRNKHKINLLEQKYIQQQIITRRMSGKR